MERPTYKELGLGKPYKKPNKIIAKILDIFYPNWRAPRDLKLIQPEMTEADKNASYRRHLCGTAFTNKEYDELVEKENEYREQEMGHYLDMEDYLLIEEYIYNQVLTREQKIDLSMDTSIKFVNLAEKFRDEKPSEDEKKEMLKNMFS